MNIFRPIHYTVVETTRN